MQTVVLSARRRQYVYIHKYMYTDCPNETQFNTEKNVLSTAGNE